MKLATLVLCAAFLWPAVASPATYVVRPDGSGDFPTIQAAVDAVLEGDVIELADGIFTGDGNRDITFYGKDLIVRSQSGDPNTCAIDCEGAAGNEHRGFYFYYGETPASVVDGITIRGGYKSVGGGAIYCAHSAAPTITNCILEGNSGGGVRCWYSASPTLIDCVLRFNSGGTVDCWNSSATLRDCTFLNNVAEAGGGLSSYNSTVGLTGCVFERNHGLANGGGIDCYAGTLTADGCTFLGNWVEGITAPRNRGGGILCEEAATVVLTDCVFLDNYVSFPGETSFGGGLYCQGSTVTVVRGTFDGNQALYGAAIACEACSADIRNCTMVRNAAPFSGGGVWCDNAFPVLRNNIIAFNLNGAAVTCYGGADPQLICCDIYGNATGDWIGCIADQQGLDGNMCEDPQFCDFQADDLTLWIYSPCGPAGDCGLIGAWPLGCWDQQGADDAPLSSGKMVWGAPNPFVGGTTVAFRAGLDGGDDEVSIAIHDVAGRLVRTLDAPSANGAAGQVWWDGADALGRSVPGGIYWLHATIAGRTASERLVRIR